MRAWALPNPSFCCCIPHSFLRKISVGGAFGLGASPGLVLVMIFGGALWQSWLLLFLAKVGMNNAREMPALSLDMEVY